MSEFTQRIARGGGISLLVGANILSMAACSNDGEFTRFAVVECPGLGTEGEIPTFPEYIGPEDGDLEFNCRPPKSTIEVLEDADRDPETIVISDEKPALETNAGLFEIRVRLNSDLPTNPNPVADVLTYDASEQEFIQLRTDTESVSVEPLFYPGDAPEIR